MKRFAPILPLLLITLGCAPAQAAVTAGAGAGAGAGDQALNPVAELDASGALQAVYVYATRGHVPSLVHRRVGGGWQHLRLLTDHRGSARMAVDTTNGDIVWQASYTAYGERTLQVEAAAELIPFGFAGGLHDEKTSLVRFGVRDLDPRTGRWTTPDPLGFSAGDTNLYSYAGNDPINFIDPTGLQSIGCMIGSLAGMFLPFGDLIDAAREALSGNFGLAALSVAAMAFPVVKFGRWASRLGSGGPRPRFGRSFDDARREAFEKAGLTDPAEVVPTKFDPATGTAVEFKGPGGAKVGYDGPHSSPGPHHDVPHISWQSAGKRGTGGTKRGNIPYDGPPHPSRPDRKDEY